jgi:hypothetical protein
VAFSLKVALGFALGSGSSLWQKATYPLLQANHSLLDVESTLPEVPLATKSSGHLSAGDADADGSAVRAADTAVGDATGLADGAVAAQPAIAIDTSNAPVARRTSTADHRLRRFDSRPSPFIASPS